MTAGLIIDAIFNALGIFVISVGVLAIAGRFFYVMAVSRGGEITTITVCCILTIGIAVILVLSSVWTVRHEAQAVVEAENITTVVIETGRAAGEHNLRSARGTSGCYEADLIRYVVVETDQGMIIEFLCDDPAVFRSIAVGDTIRVIKTTTSKPAAGWVEEEITVAFEAAEKGLQYHAAG